MGTHDDCYIAPHYILLPEDGEIQDWEVESWEKTLPDRQEDQVPLDIYTEGKISNIYYIEKQATLLHHKIHNLTNVLLAYRVNPSYTLTQEGGTV